MAQEPVWREFGADIGNRAELDHEPPCFLAPPAGIEPATFGLGMHSAIASEGKTSHSSEPRNANQGSVFADLPSFGLNSLPKLDANLQTRAADISLAVYLRELATGYAMTIADRAQS